MFCKFLINLRKEVIMKRNFFIILGLLLCMFQVSFSQTQTVTYSENFDNPASFNWRLSASNSTALANGWKIHTRYYTSSPNSYGTAVPNQKGDYVILETPVYDLSGMSFIEMRFKHICKVSPYDIVRIEYLATSQSWQSIPQWSYMGNASNYETTNAFNAESYTNWQVGNIAAMPDSSWWKEELFDLSNLVPYDANVQIRFFLQRGTTDGTNVSYGWLIDDFELFGASHEVRVPIVEFVAPLVNDTVNSTGPWEINAKVKTTTTAPLYQPTLFYTAVNGQQIDTATLLMTHVSGDSLWKASIPQFVTGTNVSYSATGTDTNTNTLTVSSSYYIKQPDDLTDVNSIAMFSIDCPAGNVVQTGASIPIVISIHNKGTADLATATIYWKVNSDPVQSFPWSGNLVWDLKKQDTIGTFTSTLYGYDTITVWVSSPNGQIDPVTSDDTLQIVVFGCEQPLSGTKIAGVNFTTLDELYSIMENCGIGGDVILEFPAYTYPYEIDLSNISNYFGNYSLTIRSYSEFGGTRENVIFKPATGGTAFLLNNSHNITIENITIDVSSGGHGIRFAGDASNITINNCIIKASTTTETTEYYAPVYKAGYINSMSGQLLHTEVIQSEPGEHIIKLNTSNLATGIYVYSMEYNGQKITKRMSIKR